MGILCACMTKMAALVTNLVYEDCEIQIRWCNEKHRGDMCMMLSGEVLQDMYLLRLLE